jgi:predicted NAD-dependent protein-ADP-ribosyltransferase YbiA (DUF1768 family)
MELYPAEAENMRKRITEWLESPEQELEATFGVGGRVDVITFLSVAKRLRARGYRALGQEDRLTITLPEHIRFTLLGLGVIQSYCNDDMLVGKPYVAMIKDRTVPDANVDLDDYDVRLKMRREKGLDVADPKVKELLLTWKQQRKAFRMIRRWSFEGEGMVIDLSIVRGTQRDATGSYRWMKSFKDQDIMASAPFYEIEVELHRVDGDTVDSVMKRLIKGMGEVLRGIQKHTFLIRKSVRDRVLRSYREISGTDRFRGNAPVTLEAKNFTAEREEKIPNLRDGYNVTDKADGLRVMALCDGKGELFMLDMSLNVYKTGLTNMSCRNSLLDGEWVTKTKDNMAISQLLLFDCYVNVEKRSVTDKPFQGEEGRFAALKKWISTWNEKVAVAPGITAATKLQVAMKNFFFAEKDDTSIFLAASRALDLHSVYNTDGLIFTPNAAPLPAKAGVAFFQQFKWKPAHDNTIDFLVSFEKFTDSREDRITVAVKPDTGETITYKTLRLLVGSSMDSRLQNPRDSILQGVVAASRKAEYRPVAFNPIEFPDTMASICYLEMKTDPDTGEDYVVTDAGEPIQEKSIVEMAYEPSESPGWRWKPLRVRMDKTERLQRGILGRTLNSDMVAEGVWNSIHDPITESMIRTGGEQPSEKEMSVFSKESEGREAVARRYYDRKAPEKDLMKTRGMRSFHNQWVKKVILYGTGLGGGNKTLLDLAVGKAADLQIWRKARISFVLGVDNAGDNITDPSDGAYRRYLNTKIEHENLSPMVFAIADSSKRLIDGSAGATDQEKDILRSVLGRMRPAGAVPPLVEKEGAGRLKMGADCVSLMFAIHYFFANKEMLDGLLQNIADGLKVGGYFVGCCFDGQKTFDLLRGIPKGGKKTGMDGSAVLWSVTKEYDEDDLPEDETSLGLGVEVEFISIGAPHREYLVSFPYLKKRMMEIGCELLTDAELKEVGLQQSTSLFDVSYDMAVKAKQKFPMPEAVKQFSFLNRWFIFKRKMERVVDKGLEVEVLPSSALPPAPVAGIVPVPATEKKKPRIVTEAAALKATLAKNEKRLLELKIEAPVTPAEKKEVEQLESQVQADKKKLAAVVVKEAEGPSLEENLPVAEAAPAARTIAVAATAVPATTYAVGEVFQFYSGAALQDKLKINDKGAGRWLAPQAPFPIEEDGTQYPTLEHYMAAMLYKRATNKPELAVSLFSRDGAIHQEYIRQRLGETSGGTKLLSEDRDFELLKQEAEDVRAAIRPAELKKRKVTFDAGVWASVKDEVLRTGLKQRWERDARLRKIIETVRAQGKILLYYSPGAATNLGGVRKDDGRIEGDNKIGKIWMELANFPGY